MGMSILVLKDKLKSRPSFPPPQQPKDGHACPTCFVTVVCVCALTAILVLSFFLVTQAQLFVFHLILAFLKDLAL